MQLSDKEAQKLKESIDELTKAVLTVAERLTGLSNKLGIVAKAINTSSAPSKD